MIGISRQKYSTANPRSHDDIELALAATEVCFVTSVYVEPCCSDRIAQQNIATYEYPLDMVARGMVDHNPIYARTQPDGPDDVIMAVIPSAVMSSRDSQSLLAQ